MYSDLSVFILKVKFSFSVICSKHLWCSVGNYENFNHDIICISGSEIIESVSLKKLRQRRLEQHSIWFRLDVVKSKDVSHIGGKKKAEKTLKTLFIKALHAAAHAWPFHKRNTE